MHEFLLSREQQNIGCQSVTHSYLLCQGYLLKMKYLSSHARRRGVISEYIFQEEICDGEVLRADPRGLGELLMAPGYVSLPKRDVPVLREADVLVAGGGAAGVAAAIGAARSGANVVLLERNGFLGGTMTAATLGGICGMYSLIDGVAVQMVFGLAEEVRAGLERTGGTKGPVKWMRTASLPYDQFVLKAVLDELAREPRLEVIYHSRIVDAVAPAGNVEAAVVAGRSGYYAVHAAIFVDCTGDAELCMLAGGAVQYEPHELQFPSAMFRMGGIDTDRAMRVPREELHYLLERAVADGHNLPRTAGGVYSVRDGIVHLNITKVKVNGRSPDPFDPAELSEAEHEGRRQASLYLQVFRRYVPGYERAFILDTGSEIGIRESRRVDGDYIVTGEDVLAERRFEDAIAANCWPVEDHGAARSTRWLWLSPGGFCHIPYRALLPRGLENLIVAGRCLSSTHEAQASLRVTANCFSMGQAAGIAAALAQGGRLRDVDPARLQRELVRVGAVFEPAPNR
jgi:glycine/D-amino acid oxidase-like deaminating enzyme